MNDDRPSIVALQLQTEQPTREDFADDGPVCARCHASFMIPSEMELTVVCDPCAQQFVSDDAPILLAIAAAAMAYENAECDSLLCEHPAHQSGCAIIKTGKRLTEALAKVRQ